MARSIVKDTEGNVLEESEKEKKNDLVCPEPTCG